MVYFFGPPCIARRQHKPERTVVRIMQVTVTEIKGGVGFEGRDGKEGYKVRK